MVSNILLFLTKKVKNELLYFQYRSRLVHQVTSSDPAGWITAFPIVGNRKWSCWLDHCFLHSSIIGSDPWITATPTVRINHLAILVATLAHLGTPTGKSHWNAKWFFSDLMTLTFDLWPLTLIYELDLNILPLDLNARIQVCISINSSGRVRRTKLLHLPLTLGTLLFYTVLLLDTYASKIAKICDLKTIWPLIQLINPLFKIRQKAFLHLCTIGQKGFLSDFEKLLY